MHQEIVLLHYFFVVKPDAIEMGSLKLLLLFSSFCVLLSATASTYSEEGFLQCLLKSSPPQNPISSAIFTPKHGSSYSSVLQAYIRDARFNTSSTPKPVLIVTALHECHVQASVLCAQKHGLEMRIRSGGHDYEALSYVSKSPFFILDMFNLRNITVNVKEESAWVQVGATLGEVYYRIAEKSRIHGFPGGVCPTMGVGGHVSGGGYGNMMRKYGLTVDNVVDAVLVDVKGRILDRSAMGEDLFWAIRGGGGSSFGVVISYKIKLVRVPENVTVFSVERTQAQNAAAIVEKWQDIAPKIDDDLFIRLNMDVVNGSKTGEKTVRATFLSMFLGNSDKLVSLVNKKFPELGLKKSDCIEMSWAQSVLFWMNYPLGTPEDALLSRIPPFVLHWKRKSDYVVQKIPADGLELIWKKMIELETPTLTFNPYGGKMAEIPSFATPFPHRAGILWKIQYVTIWTQPGDEASNKFINLTTQLYDTMTPYVSKNPRQAFLNYRDIELGVNHQGSKSYEEGRVYGLKYFLQNFDRLVKIKTKVDPGNFFRHEQSIPTLPVGSK